MNDQLVEKYADKLVAALEAAAGPTAEAALLYAWTDAARVILAGLLSLVACIGLIPVWRTWRFWVRKEPDDDYGFFSAVGLAVASALMALIALSTLSNVTAWVAFGWTVGARSIIGRKVPYTPTHWRPLPAPPREGERQ